MSSTMGKGSALWAAGRELANKTLAYTLVRTSGFGRVAVDDRWEELVAAVYRRDPHSALFRLERLGHDLAAATWDRSGPPRDLFRGARAAALPERSLLLLHGGMGLAFAERLLGALPDDAGEGELAATLGRIVALCRDNARPGCAGTALETVGVYVRVFHTEWTLAAGRLLAALDEEARCRGLAAPAERPGSTRPRRVLSASRRVRAAGRAGAPPVAADAGGGPVVDRVGGPADRVTSILRPRPLEEAA